MLLTKRDLLLTLLSGCGKSVFSFKDKGFISSSLMIPPPQPHHMIDFEALGGVGDGDPDTGRGTDNADAFERAEVIAQQGYGIKFKAKACYKTTKQINIHNMYWIGDGKHNPVIFAWFPGRGKSIIGRSKKTQNSSVCIIGITFHRCGPFAEHGIVVDNIERLYFEIAVTSRPGAQGGAIGISPFFPANRHSRNCFIKARINNSGDFGIQLGSVSGALIDVVATDCYREVVGIEPIVRGTLIIDEQDIVDNKIFLSNLDISIGDLILYCSGDTSRGPLIPGRHYFVINNGDGSISLADSCISSFKGRKLNLGKLKGSHYFAKSAIVEDVVIRSAKIIDNHAKKPTLYANTMGYVILTGNSGGYMTNINIDKVYIEGNQIYPDKQSVGVYVQGVRNLTLENIEVFGCDDAITVSDGWLNGMFDEAGHPIHIEKGFTRIPSDHVIVVDPKLVDFRNRGVTFRGTGGILRGGRFSSRVKSSKIVVRE